MKPQRASRVIAAAPKTERERKRERADGLSQAFKADYHPEMSESDSALSNKVAWRLSVSASHVPLGAFLSEPLSLPHCHRG
ncbi:hypothetical protein AMECASPLE_002643 [Ameca splendens]|uniref:Uncharacterized protein n=1 Tax=Ameca splendens TaxID=208324 RepID=A0ABV0ZUK4_9TELE